MNAKMTPLPFASLVEWMQTEYLETKSLFGVHSAYRHKGDTLSIFGEKLEVPFGPAAGPNTQLAQNIIAAYFAGARFFELKTVQVIDGEALAECVARPCILAREEGYNCEWSTELTVPDALAEYIKAWCALKVISRAFELGDPDGFIFNMSVGYDLKGIQSEKVDAFIETLKDASSSPVFSHCKAVLKKAFPAFADMVDAISPHICRSVTLSTLHGCPPDEIERIAQYLIEKKGLHTFVKCNPTILGYDTARAILDQLGYTDVAFTPRHFEEDLQYADAVPMFRRLKALSGQNGLEFGLKLSNTFPVDVKNGELPAQEMYMSGKALFALTIEMANRFCTAFDGKMRISYSGGADASNCKALFDAGIWPVTAATTLLKPGGYNRLRQIATLLSGAAYSPFAGCDTAAVALLAKNALSDPRYRRALKPLSHFKNGEPVPLTDCFTAPCRQGCPFGQDVPAYMALCEAGEYERALQVILQKNPLPNITGAICSHNCTSRCTRNFYDTPVHIRETKAVAAQKGYAAALQALQPEKTIKDRRVAVIGGGPTGMAAAFFTARAGIPTVLFEQTGKLGGVVRHVIPPFRISEDVIERDAAFLFKLGVEIRLHTKAPSIKALKAMGFTDIFIAVGAAKRADPPFAGESFNAIDFLTAFRQKKVLPARRVVIIGGGNTAMDAARAALRLPGVQNVTIAYRRTKSYMPAHEEEILLAQKEGAAILELVQPERFANKELTLQKNTLGEPDENGRRRPVPTGETIVLPADLVVFATGEQVDPAFFKENGISPQNGKIPFFTGIPGVYNGGDSMRGPATVAQGIADALRFAECVTGKPIGDAAYPCDPAKAYRKKGVLCDAKSDADDRCLSCDTICENCVDVCPNRANVVIVLADGSHQILHIDRLCNACGNCETFCPYSAAPFKDKLTLYAGKQDFEASDGSGFYLDENGRAVSRLQTRDQKASELIDTVVRRYRYLFGEEVFSDDTVL